MSSQHLDFWRATLWCFVCWASKFIAAVCCFDWRVEYFHCSSSACSGHHRCPHRDRRLWWWRVDELLPCPQEAEERMISIPTPSNNQTILFIIRSLINLSPIINLSDEVHETLKEFKSRNMCDNFFDDGSRLRKRRNDVFTHLGGSEANGRGLVLPP